MLELVSKVIAGLHRVVRDERDEVRICVHRERRRASSAATSATSSGDSKGRFIFVSAKP